MRSRFDAFLQQNPQAAKNAQSDADREALFKQFEAWQADQTQKQNARAQAQTSEKPARHPHIQKSE
jgi:hypothetical protein